LPSNTTFAGLACSQDSRYLFHCATDTDITQYDLRTNKDVCVYKTGHNGQVTSLAVNAHDTRLVSCCYKGNYCFYDIPQELGDGVQTQVSYGSLPMIKGNKYWLSIFMHGQDGESKTVALVYTPKKEESNEVRIIDSNSKSVIKTFKVNKKEQKICDLAVTFDNRKIICGGSTTTNIIVIDIESGVIHTI